MLAWLGYFVYSVMFVQINENNNVNQENNNFEEQIINNIENEIEDINQNDFNTWDNNIFDTNNEIESESENWNNELINEIEKIIELDEISKEFKELEDRAKEIILRSRQTRNEEARDLWLRTIRIIETDNLEINEEERLRILDNAKSFLQRAERSLNIDNETDDQIDDEEEIDN